MIICTLWLEHFFYLYTFVSDSAETTHGITKFLDKRSCGNAGPVYLQGLIMALQNHLFQRSEHRLKKKVAQSASISDGLFISLDPALKKAMTFKAMTDLPKALLSAKEALDVQVTTKKRRLEQNEEARRHRLEVSNDEISELYDQRDQLVNSFDELEQLVQLCRTVAEKKQLLKLHYDIRVKAFGWKGWKFTLPGGISKAKPDELLQHFRNCYNNAELIELEIPPRPATKSMQPAPAHVMEPYQVNTLPAQQPQIEIQPSHQIEEALVDPSFFEDDGGNLLVSL